MSNEGLSYKVVLVGDTGCGKTSVFYKYKYNAFKNDSLSTVCGDLNTVLITSPAGQSLKMHVWDTAGQEKYRSLVKMYYRGAYAIIFVFDVSRIETLRNIPRWYQECDNIYRSEIQLFLVGNKSDLIEDPDVLSLVKTYVSEYHFRYVATSAKDGTGIDVLFKDIITRIGLHYDFDYNKETVQKENFKLEVETPVLSYYTLYNPCC